ncbi:ATP-binding protein [Nevskia sp.]|uniref:ATP-binding protein n=1 Tax=Nevskia sp. TaxID=1929292 RepID=UPI0025EEF62D|nr:ATP-binding protein [Nevskia sp.]
MTDDRETALRQCDKHGDYTAHWVQRLDRWTGCETCAHEERAANQLLLDEEYRQERIEEWLRESDIPSKFRHAAFDGSLPEKLRRWVEAVARRESRGPLVIIGPVGTGKTYASSAALKQIIRSDMRGLFITAGGYGRTVRETWNRRGEHTEASLLGKYGCVPVLVLDEFGANRDVDAPMLQDLISARYDEGRMPNTIIVSNLAVAKFPDVAGERVADRIKEDATVLLMTGKSKRTPLA